MPDRPSVMFVCVKNSGKSQMAAGLMRTIAGDRIDVYSAGTRPGAGVNTLSAEVLAEVGIDISHESTKPIDRVLLESMTAVVTLGLEDRRLHPSMNVDIVGNRIDVHRFEETP